MCRGDSERVLFVYGTLRQGSGHEMSRLLRRSSDFLDTAVFRGRLYLVAQFPGVVPSDDPNDCVHGELYRLRTPASTLHALDRYEGCNPLNAQALYIRRVRPITRATGANAPAWIYLYNGGTHALRRIASGDFLEFLRHRV